MIKEIKNLFFVIIIVFFLFFTFKYYFSDNYKKKSFRSLNNIENRIKLYAENLPILDDNTKNIIEYSNKNETKKKKKFHFWDLLNKND
tara:strand:+ start:186 stop:449 length:264 start_codon:yes stop_codon:yes gene_type:complete